MYERKVVYLFQYHGNTRGKNIGYVKWSRSSEDAKLILNIKGLHLTKDIIGECSLLLEKKKVRLGKVYLKNAVAEGKYMLDREHCRHLAEENIKPVGVLVTFGEVWCAASFSEETLDLNVYEEINRETNTEINKETGEQKNHSTVAEQDEIEKESEKKEETKKKNIEEKNTGPETEDIYIRLKELFPTIHPFEKVENKEYLSITPREIEFFRKEYFTLVNNSFLLHGYQNYKYLILGKNYDDNQYFIGVPGVYFEKEEMMAKMFGFDIFLPALNEEKKQGSFGYYIKVLE